MTKTAELITAETNYKQPGTGAIEFALQFIGEITKEEALPIIIQLINEELHDATDKRVKRCAYCNYHFRDATRPNNGKTCSRPCKVASDTLTRAMKKADKELLKGEKKKTKRETFYVSWIEYPFWINEYEMLKHSWKHEVSSDNIEQIIAAKQRDALLGGKKKGVAVVGYSGNEVEQAKIYVRFPEVDRSNSEVSASTMKACDIDAYYIEKYGERHMQHERKRVLFMKEQLKGYETNIK